MDATSRYLDAVSEISEAVNETFDLDHILQIGLKTILRFEGLKAGTIRLIDRQSGMLVLKAYDGFPSNAIEKLRNIRLGEKSSGLAAMMGEPVVIKDISSTSWLAEIAELRPKLKSLASVPLRSRDNIVGALNVYSQHADHFTPTCYAIAQGCGFTDRHSRREREAR